MQLSGFVHFNNPDMWQATQTEFANYRAKLIRAVSGVSEADLSVTKSGASSGSNQVTWNIQVSNAGPGTATNVVVTDPLAACSSYVSDTCGGTNVPPWTWNVGDLADGASASCSIVVDVSGCSGLLANTATATGDQTDPAPGNNAGTGSVSLLPAPEPVPAIGLLGLLALLAAMGLTAGLVLRR